MKRTYWIFFALICLVFLFGVIVGTVTQKKGEPITYPQKVRE